VLWYKAWIETRARFLGALCSITFIIGFLVYHNDVVLDPPVLFNNYFLSRIDIYLMGMWLLSVVLFAMGGLMHEKSVGTSSFTLTLPVSRADVLFTRILMGLLQTVLAAVVPWTAILVVSDHFRKPFPLSQAALYVLLLVSGGLVYFALAILVSTLIEGEYTAAALACGLTLVTMIMFAASGWSDPYLNIGKFMTGGFLFENRTYLLAARIPWAGLISCWSAAAAMLVASIIVTERHEF
jgi:ABC-2 type transport system permease protein